MRKIFTFLLALMSNIIVFGQTVTIGTGTGTSDYAPIDPYFGYNYTQQIYTSAEISAGGATSGQQITKIRFYYSTAAGTVANFNNWTVYIGNTTQSTFSGTTNWIATSSMTQVFSGTVTFPAAGNWLEITLSTPFTWNGDNIVVAVDENSSNYGNNVSCWRYTSTSSNYRTIYYQSDSNNPNPASPPTATGRTYNRPNIQMVFSCVTQITDNKIYANGNSESINVSSGETFTISSSGGNTSAYCYWASNDGGATWTILTQANCNQPSFTYSLGTVGSYIFHVRNYDGCGYCWDAAHGANCTCGADGSDCIVSVNVLAPPATPGTPTSNSPQCNSVTITRNGTPPAGETWYWQTSASGTDITSSGTTYAVSSSGTYYIRSKRTSDGVWSSAASETVVVNNVPAAVSSPSPSNGATGVCYAGVGAVSSISWTASATATSYDVYFGTSSNPPLVSTSQAGISYSTGTLASNTTYYCKVIAKNGCGNSSEISWSFTTSSVNCYCSSTSTSGSSYFNSFSTTGGLTNITNSSSGYSAGGFGSFLNQSVSQSVGGTVNFNTSLTGTTVGVKIWVDWNQDGDFVDSGEEVYWSGSSYVSAASGSFIVPISATPGATVMRIRMDYNATAPAICGSITRGETEDYTFNVIEPPATPGTPTSNTPQCNSVTITRNGTPPAGETWYWQTSASGTDITSSGSTYTATTSGTYYIRSKRTSDGVWSVAASTTVIVNFTPPAVASVVPSNGATGVCYSGDGAVSEISWTASSGATSYDVYFGTASNPPLVSTSQAGVNYNTGALSANTIYYCKVIAKNVCGNSSATSWSFTTSNQICYCSSTSTSGSSYFNSFSTTGGITNITNNSSGYSTGGYGNFKNLTVSQNINSTVNFNTSLTGTTVGVKIWVDWNQDGDFLDTGEEVYWSGSSFVSAASGSFIVPTNALPGNTVMRIRMDYNLTSPAICGSIARGETEDYTFNVVQPAYAAQYISQNTGSSSWCAGETRTVSVTIKNTGSQPWTDGSGEDFNIGIKWNGDPDYLVRVDAQNLASGSTATYNLTVTAPASGSNNLTFNVVREGIAWFGGTYSSPAITINALPTSVNAGSDVFVCSGGNVQLNGSANATASSASSYTFSTISGVSLENLSSPDATTISTGQDDVASSLITIPFTFNFAGSNYTQTSFSSNGLLTLGGTVVNSSNQTSDNLTSGITPMPLIAPWWDDGHTGTNGNVRYKTIGTSPNRKFVVEWNFRTYSNESGNYTKTVQIWMFESSNILQFVYGTGTSVTYSNGAQIGISSSVSSYQGINTTNHTASLVSNNNGQTTWPGSGRSYIFSPTITYSWSPSTGLSANNVANPTASPSSTTTYTMTASANGCSATDDIIVNVNSLSTAPTSITGLTSICSGGSTTLTASGGTNGTGVNNVWYSGSCASDIYTQQWATQPFSTPNTTVNSLTNGILRVTSQNNDPMIDMGSLGSFDPSIYKYINIRYRVISGTAGNVEIFFYNTTHNYAVGGETGFGSLISDGAWHVVSVDMSTDPEYSTGGNIQGWRYDWATASGVTMDIDYISLSNKPIIGEGNSITVSPSTNTTYYTAKKGECNTTSCASTTVTVNSAPTAPTSIIGTTTICSGGTTTLMASGGIEGSGCSYQWGIGSSVGSNIIGTAISDTYTTSALSSNTTFWVRRVGNTGCTNTTGGVTQLITVNSPPTAPTSISGNSSINPGESTTITANGGSEGSGCSYEWYEGSCGSGSSLGSASSINVSPLVNTTYYVRRVGNNICTDVTSCAQVTITVNSPSYTWTGAINTDWNTAGNWSSAIVPNTTKNAIIPNVANKPVINQNIATPAQCNNLTINAGSSVTINAGKALTVNGDLINNGTITIKSSVSNDGSLIVIGNRTGSGLSKIERYLTANKWHLIGSPITSATSNVFVGNWLRTYDESINTYGPYITATNLPLIPGQGYSVWSNSNQTKLFTGTFNHGNIGPINLALSGLPDINTGWNLIGNPYPSAIDWNSATGWTKTNVGNTIYIWNNSQYATYNGIVGTNGGSNFIASCQGFLVQASSAGSQISINNNARVHNSGGYLKNGDPINTIRVQVFNQEYSDEIVISVRDNATDEFDYEKDAVKIFGSSNAPQMYTLKGNSHILSINNLNSINKIIGMVINIEYAGWGEHYLLYKNTLETPFVPILFDNVMHSVVLPNNPYLYIASPNDPKERFQFIEPLNTNISSQNESNLFVWESNNILNIENFGNEILKSVLIFDIQGKLVLSCKQSQINLNSYSAGNYVVKIITDKQIKITKITIK